MLYAFAEKYLLLLLNLAGSMVLARLLTPAEVGVYAIGAVVVGIAQVVRDFGVGAYLVQDRRFATETLRAALAVSLVLGWAMALALWVAAGPLAQFYGELRVATVLQWLAVNFLLLPFTALAMACLRRQLRFGAIFFINAAQTLAQLGTGVWLAWRGFGYLSLVWGAVAGSLASLLATLCCRPPGLPWRPGWAGVAALWRFGALSTAGTVVDEAGVAAPELIIAKTVGVAEVGLFGKAQAVVGIFNQLVTAAVTPVLYPSLAADVRAGRDVHRAYLDTVACMTALAWPFYLLAAVMAPAIVSLLYGPQWCGAAPLVRIICLGAAGYSVFGLARYLLLASGGVAALARLDTLAVSVRVSLLLGAAPFGLQAIAWAVAAGALFRSWLTARALRQLHGLQWRQLLRVLRPSACIAMLCAPAPLLATACLLTPAWQVGAAAAGTVCLWMAGVGLTRHRFADEGRRLLLQWRARYRGWRFP